LRVPGPTFLTMYAALFTGGVFIFSTYHWWTAAGISGLLAFVFILIWLWTGTALIPEKHEKEVGLGVTLPIYVSGPDAVGWWAMFITMLGDMTAFISLVFGYFFYWTIHDDFPPQDVEGPGWVWPVMSLISVLLAWGATIFANRLNRADKPVTFYSAMAVGALFAVFGGFALFNGLYLSSMNPTLHVYQATVWVLVLWTVVHVCVGIVMQLYCVARRAAGRMTARYDADIVNVSLYWHFLALTTAITVAVIAGFPLVA
jgi:heme/copper-type cytochrome/quinol oxidase subunit 3